MVSRLSELRHVQMARVAVSFAQARKRVPHGLCATLTPMRFENGSTIGVRGGRRYRAQQLFDARGREMLYILSFYLPRFLDLDFQEKLATTLHELWHISPQFNGDLRRHSGRCYAHSPSQKQYDQEMAQLAARYLALSPPRHFYAFLRSNFDQLYRQHGGVYGMKIPHPKLIPLD